MSLKDLAKSFPDPIKQGLRYLYGAIPPSIRYGKVFWETYNFLKESQWWSRGKLEEYQIQQLEKLLKHAYENVPYYRRVLDERGLKPKDIQDFDDLKKLPYLTKDSVRENLSDLIARNYPKSKLQYITTCGSTGIPLGFYQEKGILESKEWAFMFTQWNRIGFKIGDRCVVLRGDIIRSASKGKFWKYDPVNKNLILSSYHITDKTLPKYIEKIKEFRPDFIQAYPSAITILAKFMKKHTIGPLSNIKALLCGSENLYSWQRKFLEEVFQCQVYSWYGHTEKAVLAGECEKNICYHIFPEYGFAELLDDDGNPLTKEDEMGEIVVTGFNNYVCPFIRYRTRDLAVPANGDCECRRNYPLLKRVEGRLQELMISKDGRLISHIAWTHDAEWNKIKQIQFLQEKQGEVIIKVVRNTSYSKAETERDILRLYRPKFEGLCEVSLRFVDNIPRTPSGKYRFLIQKLPIKWGD